MRTFFLPLFFILSTAAAAADSLSLAQQLSQSGAPQLALYQVERDQPPPSADPQWFDWESLRFTLLSQLGKAPELIARMQALPSPAPRDFLQKAYGHAAWAHLQQNEGAAARIYLARLLWQFPLTPVDRQWARRLVIRSYLVEHKANDAYRAMLRYQQDFAPLSKEVADEFVQGLLGEGATTEAMTWLLDLDPSSPASLRLQLKAGMVTPEAALAQAQSAMQAQPDKTGAYADIVADAAKLTGNAKLRIDALERQLALAPKPDIVANALWKAYVAQGEAAGNRVQLLLGDDASWLSAAAGTSTVDAQEGRSIYAYLVGVHKVPDTRELALSRLFASLAASRPDAAVRLFAAAPWGGEKDAIARLKQRVDQFDQGMPAVEMRALWLAASRFAAEQKQFGLAAVYCAQSVLASNMRSPDALAAEALKRAVQYMGLAGFKEDAAAFQKQMAALREPEKKQPAPAPQPAKKRK